MELSNSQRARLEFGVPLIRIGNKFGANQIFNMADQAMQFGWLNLGDLLFKIFPVL